MGILKSMADLGWNQRVLFAVALLLASMLTGCFVPTGVSSVNPDFAGSMKIPQSIPGRSDEIRGSHVIEPDQ